MSAEYKETDVGIIPSDWAVNNLEDVCERIKVGLATSVTKYYRKNGVPIIRNLNIKDGYFNSDDLIYLDETFAKANSGKAAKAFDVLTVHTGSNLGQTCVLPEEFDGCQTFTTLITSPIKRIIDPEYLCLHMSSKQGRDQMDKLKAGGGKGNLNTGELKKYRIQYPPINEQRAIASCISDVDALISQINKVISKNRGIKKAVTYQLLKGETRLPGYTKAWGVKSLSELLVYEQPTKYLVKNKEYSNINQVPVLTAGKTFILGYTSESNGIFDNLPVILFDDFTTATQYVDFSFKVKSSAMKLLKGRNSSVNLRFIYELMQLIEFGLTEHKRYWISEYQHIKVLVPDQDEQEDIMKILMDIEDEISGYEAQLFKIEMLRRGMLQNLLKGRTRLV